MSICNLNESPAYPIGLLFRQVRDVVRLGMERELAASGLEINFSQYIALKKLDLADARVTELARFAELNAGAMTRLVDQLEVKGLVQRMAEPDDRRAWRVALTATGRAMIPALVTCADRVRARALAGMTSEECDQLTHLLERVRDNMDRSE